jgi:AcrR family transcriptional regulator
LPTKQPDTKAVIKETFLSLLLQKSYSKISVKGLATEIGMSRQNFYRYYVSKEDILIDVVDDTFDHLYNILESNLDTIDTNSDQLIDQLYDALLPTKFIIGEVLDRGTDEVVLGHVQNFIRRVLGRIIRSKELAVIDHDYLDLLVAKIAGGGFYLVKTWSKQEEELDENKFKSLMLPFLTDINSLLETSSS